MGDEFLGELINKDDLRSLRHIILLRNNTSGTFILEEDKISFSELKDNGAVVTVPHHPFQGGKN